MRVRLDHFSIIVLQNNQYMAEHNTTIPFLALLLEKAGPGGLEWRLELHVRDQFRLRSLEWLLIPIMEILGLFILVALNIPPSC
jgi:hypothetical protein